VRCIEGRDCGHEAEARTVFVLGPSARWKKEGIKERCVGQIDGKGKEKEGGDYL